MAVSFLKRLYKRFLRQKKRKYLNNLVANGLNLGKNVHIIDEYFFDPSHCFLITIEDNCTICPNVRLIAHDASTKKTLGYTKIGLIHIGKNCFIGDSTIILPGVRIGPNSIIGAGSVVTKSIPGNSVAAGNPAKVLCKSNDYYKRVERAAKDKKVFNENYLIAKMNADKRQEMIDSIGDTIGFIV